MRCFVHRDTEAVGLCRGCSKGLCPACLVDLGHAITCHGACEQKAHTLHRQLQQTDTVLRSQTRNRFFLPAFVMVMGAAFMIFASDGRTLLNFGTVVGGGFVLFGLVLLVIVQRYARDLARKDVPPGGPAP